MRGHEGRDAGGDRGAKRHELNRSQAIGRVLDERQLEMRVGTGITVAGEMLAARGDALGLERSDDRRAKAGYIVGFFRERPVADDRIRRVGEDVEDRRVIERDADRAELRRQCRGGTLPQPYVYS